PRILIVGVHLNRELVLGKDELHEQREDGIMRQACAGPFGRHLPPGLAELLAGKGSARETALVSGQPDLTDGGVEGRLFREERSEGRRGQDGGLEEGIEASGRKLHELDSTGWKNLASRRRPSSMRSRDVA